MLLCLPPKIGKEETENTAWKEMPTGQAGDLYDSGRGVSSQEALFWNQEISQRLRRIQMRAANWTRYGVEERLRNMTGTGSFS